MTHQRLNIGVLNMQWKPIEYKYRKGTMKSTLQARTLFAWLRPRSHVYKLRREWKREWNRLTAKQLLTFWPRLHDFCCSVSHMQLGSLLSLQRNFANSAKYNRIERLMCFMHMADCSVFFYTVCFASFYSLNYSTRLETRTKEFNWSASRSMTLNAKA